MQDYTIDVSRIEELQMTNDVHELDTIFQKAKSAVVCGATVFLARKDIKGKLQQFDNFTTLHDLSQYRKTVYKYLKTDQQ